MWLFYALAASLIWGLDYALAEKILQGRIAPTTLVGLQMCGGGAAFLAIYTIRGKYGEIESLVKDAKVLGLVLVTVVAFALGNLMIMMAIRSKNATVASLVEVSYPLAVVIFTWLLFRTVHLNIGTALGGLLVLIGVALIYALG